MDVAVFGNFDVNTITFNADFQHGGWWYEYWSGDSMNVTNTAMQYTLGAGEYRLYTTTRLPKPNLDFVLETEEDLFAGTDPLQIWPNPAANTVKIARLRQRQHRHLRPDRPQHPCDSRRIPDPRPPRIRL
jgi:hypothetical protein